MNRIFFVKLPNVGRYFEELRENLVLASTEGNSNDIFRIEECRSAYLSSTYFRRRVTSYKSLLEDGSIGEVEREIVDIFSFRIDRRHSWIELYSPPRSLKSLMNRLSELSSGRLSYGAFSFDVVLAAEMLKSYGESKVNGLKCQSLILKHSALAFTGSVEGADLPKSFLEFSGQKSSEIQSLAIVFRETDSKPLERIELRRDGGISTSGTLTEKKRAFYRNLVKECEIS